MGYLAGQVRTEIRPAEICLAEVALPPQPCTLLEYTVRRLKQARSLDRGLVAQSWPTMETVHSFSSSHSGRPPLKA
jgi:hypothetical protein